MAENEQIVKEKEETAELTEDGKEIEAELFHKKIFTFLIMIVAMAFFVVFIILLRDDTDVMEKVIYAVGGVCAGAFGGYGFAKKGTDD